MKIIHLTESDQQGGAARGAFRLHRALAHAGVDSHMIVGHKAGDDPIVENVISPRRKKLYERLDRLPRKFFRTGNQSHLSPAWVGSSAWRAANHREPSLMHLHWICKGFLRIEDLPRLRAPLVWSLHDMWPLAGGEHYVGDCRRYTDGYLADNRPAGESGVDLNRWIWNRKRRAWAGLSQLTLFPVSQWLADRARESILLRDRPIEVLHNALDETEFKPHAHDEARLELGLPVGKPLVLFGAIDATTDTRKGFDLFIAAIRLLRGRETDLELVVFGNSPEHAQTAPSFGFRTHYLGRIDDPARLSLVYAACDVAVVPSREEAFGQTALEALACGTPVAAFRIGGLPEIVEHRVSGYLAKPFDVDDLAAGIAYILASIRTPHWQQLSAAGRAKVERSFTRKIQADRCRRLYERVLGSSERVGAPADAELSAPRARFASS